MSISNISKKSSSKAQSLGREEAKADGSETETIVKVEKQTNVSKKAEPPPAAVSKSAETIETTEKSAETAEKPEKPEEAPVATPSIDQSNWSEWIWDSTQEIWYCAKKNPDGTWQYECIEPITTTQYSQPTRIVYPNQKERVLFASESIQEVLDSRDGYLLAVREEEKFWDVEEALKASAKAATAVGKDGGGKKDATGAETEGGAAKKIEEGGEKKTAAPVAVGKGSDPAAGKNVDGAEKGAAKVAKRDDVLPDSEDTVVESASKKENKAEKESGSKSYKKQPEKDKEAKKKSKLKKKVAYFEDADEDDHKSRHRGRTRERR